MTATAVLPTALVPPPAPVGPAGVPQLSFTKYIDSASPNLIKTCCNGKHY
jgi:type VI protein secretion system component Hcp